MPCPDRETLMLLADDELPAAERAGVAEHAAECGACREFVESMRRLNRTGRSALRAIRVESPPHRIASVSRRRFPMPAVAAAALIVLGVGLAAWLAKTSSRNDGIEVSRVPAANVPVASTAPVGLPRDDAFERWSAEHRRKRVPQIPLEDVASFRSPMIQPVGPFADSTGRRS